MLVLHSENAGTHWLSCTWPQFCRDLSETHFHVSSSRTRHIERGSFLWPLHTTSEDYVKQTACTHNHHRQQCTPRHITTNVTQTITRTSIRLPARQHIWPCARCQLTYISTYACMYTVLLETERCWYARLIQALWLHAFS